MSSTVASNSWAEIIHHASDGILEQRWLPGQMTQGAFKASLALLALEAERLPPSAILIDATQFQHRPGPGGHGIAQRLHNPALWFRWRSEIRVSRPCRISGHDRGRRVGGR